MTGVRWCVFAMTAVIHVLTGHFFLVFGFAALGGNSLYGYPPVLELPPLLIDYSNVAVWAGLVTLLLLTFILGRMLQNTTTQAA